MASVFDVHVGSIALPSAPGTSGWAGASRNGQVAGETSGSLREAIFTRLLAQIYLGELAAGEVFSEAMLAERHGVSRGPAREAIGRLKGFRRVTRERYPRARVVRLNLGLVRRLCEARMALEGRACNTAAERMALAELRRLGDEVEVPRTCSTDSTQVENTGAGRAFECHERALRSCGSDRLADMLCSDPCHLLRMYRRRSGDLPGGRRQAFGERSQIQGGDGPRPRARGGVDARSHRSPQRAAAGYGWSFGESNRRLGRR